MPRDRLLRMSTSLQSVSFLVMCGHSGFLLSSGIRWIAILVIWSLPNIAHDETNTATFSGLWFPTYVAIFSHYYVNFYFILKEISIQYYS